MISKFVQAVFSSSEPSHLSSTHFLNWVSFSFSKVAEHPSDDDIARATALTCLHRLGARDMYAHIFSAHRQLRFDEVIQHLAHAQVCRLPLHGLGKFMMSVSWQIRCFSVPSVSTSALHLICLFVATTDLSRCSAFMFGADISRHLQSTSQGIPKCNRFFELHWNALGPIWALPSTQSGPEY